MKVFETPVIEVMMFAVEDVITTSTGTEQGGDVLPPTDEEWD